MYEINTTALLREAAVFILICERHSPVEREATLTVLYRDTAL